MPTPLVNPFTEFKLTAEEELQGRILTTGQKCVIQNMRSRYAQQRISLKYDPDKASQFMQEDAELQGQIVLLTFLLDTSDEAVAEHLRLKIETNSPNKGE